MGTDVGSVKFFYFFVSQLLQREETHLTRQTIEYVQTPFLDGEGECKWPCVVVSSHTHSHHSQLLSRLNLTDDPAFHPSSSDTDVRTALLVTSTSWTPDEDFDMLLSALETYEKAKASSGNSQFPNILLAITGRGPLKQEFEKRVHHLEKTWKCVRVCTVWLEPHDYPKLLGAAHLGLSFHSSSSGLDLPMKVVDMFGAGLPVCALNFACLHELVVDGVNGLTFESGTQLGGQLVVGCAVV